MSVSNKHLATILLGAAAAFGAYKYHNMSEEEKKKLSDGLKDKFHKLKDEAEGGVDNAKNYFGDLKTKAGELLKEHFPDAEKYLHDFFSNDKPAETAVPTGNSTQNSGV